MDSIFFIHALSVLCMLQQFAFSSCNETIVKWIDEGRPPGTRLLDVREELKSPLSATPNAKFQIVEQTLKSTSNSPFPPGAEGQGILEVSSAGIVRLSKRLDREKLCGKSSCYIFVKVVMLPEPSSLSLLKVEVHIRDVNDNAPRFKFIPVDVKLPESANVNHVVSLDRFQATDDDMGNNSKISYSLVRSSNFFRLHHSYDNRGLPHLELILTRNLDYEKSRVHRLTLRATDAGVKPLYSDVEIRVDVINVNDNPPIFSKQLYNVSLKEDYLPGYVITRVSATDKDRQKIRYSVKGNNEDAGLVEVDPETGVVTLREKLNHKKHDKMKILVEATDSDKLPQTATAVLLLNIDDVNDNDPTITINFIAEHDGDTAYVPESERANAYLAHVSASDVDEGDNGDVTLTVETVVPDTESFGNLTEPGYFVIKANLLATTFDFDRETRSNYDVRITACDGGIPARCSLAKITVIILDVNEFRPVFQHSNVQLELVEQTPVGSVIAVATATDGDAKNGPGLRLAEDGGVEESKNGKIQYSVTLATLSEEDEDDIPIMIDHDTGKVSLIKVLDYETRKDWQFVIFARDGGHPLALQSRLNLNLTVLDVNDNPPVFTKPARNNLTIYASTIGEEEHFYQLKAMDFDEHEHLDLKYSIKVVSKDGNGKHRRRIGRVFKLDASEGTLALAKGFVAENMLGVYRTIVEVTDGGIPPLTSSLTLYIHVINTVAPIGVHADANAAVNKDNFTLIVAGGAGGGIVILIVIIIVVVVLARRKRKPKSAQLVTRANDDGTSSTNTRTSSTHLGSPTSVRRDSRHSNICNTTLCDHGGNGAGRPCQLCDIPNSPRAMQTYLEQQQGKHSNPTGNHSTRSARMSRGSRSTSGEPMFSATVFPMTGSPTTPPFEVSSLGEKCTSECKLKGHSDRCWMPSSELVVSNPSSPTENKGHSWKQPSRKDSSCSDTASSGISYYKMPTRRQSAPRSESTLPDVVARSRHVTGSDASSMMSSATSSGASSNRPAKYSSFNQRSPTRRTSKKSNSDSGYDASLASYKDKTITEGATEC